MLNHIKTLQYTMYNIDNNMPGPWHNKIQSYFPKSNTEVKFLCSSKDSTTENRLGIMLNDTCRRADVLLNDTRTCEIQHSFMTCEEVTNRSKDWKKFGKEIIWFIDGNTGIICEKLTTNNYLIVFNDDWKYNSFIQTYDYILLEIDSKVFKIELKKVKCKMIELKMFLPIEEVVHILQTEPESIWDKWDDDNVVKCTLSVHQEGAGNGKTYGVWKRIATNMDKSTYSCMTKTHAQVVVIYKELTDQTVRQEYHIENLTEKTEENTNTHFVIKYTHKESKRECIVIIGTIDSFCCNLSGSSKTCDNFFEGILSNIRNNGLTKVSASGYMKFGGQSFALNKHTEIWIDEVQDLPVSYLYAMAKLMLETNCDIHIVGDTLQSLEHEVNFLTSVVDEKGLTANINVVIHTPININRRIRVKGMRREINGLIDFNKWGVPEIDCSEEPEEEVTEKTIQIIESPKIYAKDTDFKKIDKFIEKIIERGDYEVNKHKYTPDNFIHEFPIMKDNNLALELLTKWNDYWIKKFADPDYIQSLDDTNYWKNYPHNQYTEYVHLHKHTEGTCINTKDSVRTSRIMSIRTSKGDGREVVFVLGITEESLKRVSGNKIGLVYESHLHVALTRAKCKIYFCLEPNGDKIHKLFNKCGYVEHFPTITHTVQLDKIFDNIDKKKMIELLEKNNIKQDDFIIKHVNTEPKESVDWGYHCIKYCTYYYRTILNIVKKRYENTDFNESQLSVILNKLSNIPIEPMNVGEYYTFLKKCSRYEKGATCIPNLPKLPLCNLSDKPDYNRLFMKIKDAMKKIQVCITADELDLLNVYESVILVYMIKLYTDKVFVDISPTELYNITNFFRNHSKECKLLTEVENVDTIICEALDHVDVKTRWNIQKHMTLKSINDDFTICNGNFPILGYSENNITHIMLKTDINALNFWDIMIHALLERFLIYNPRNEKDIEKYENKQITTYMFGLTENRCVKLDWEWDKAMSTEIKTEVKRAMILHFSSNHEEIYNYFCYIKNEPKGKYFGGDLETKTPFQYIFTKMKDRTLHPNYPTYIIRVFEELHDMLVRGNKEDVKNICGNMEVFCNMLRTKLEIACDNYLGTFEKTDYDF